MFAPRFNNTIGKSKPLQPYFQKIAAIMKCKLSP